MTSQHFDIAIIGSGIAGGALVAALKGSGLSVLVLDRRSGNWIPPEAIIYSRQCSPCCPAGACWIGCWKRVLSAERARGGLMREGAHIVTVPVPQRDDCAGAFLFLNHEKIGDILLDTAKEAGAVNITGLSDWSLTRAAGSWRVDWQVR